jgi:hypothetical protein
VFVHGLGGNVTHWELLLDPLAATHRIVGLDIVGCGATGTASTGYYVGNLLEETLGAKFNTLTGYKDGPEVDLAVERGEIQCRGISLETLFGREPLIGWSKNGFVRVLIQTGKKRDSKLPDVPTIWELMNEHKTTDAGKRLATIILAVGRLAGRVQFTGFAGQANSSGRFQKTLTDPDCKLERAEIGHRSGRRRGAGYWPAKSWRNPQRRQA